MASKNQPDRWEATWLAVVMAIAGAPFLFDKLGILVHTSFLSVPSFLHSAPVPLVAVGAILLLAEQGALPRQSYHQEERGERHEL
jgi:hypothetical protein